MNSEEKWVIRGVTEEGKKLRPSDWIERISSTLANFGKDQRLQYSNAVAPCMIDAEVESVQSSPQDEGPAGT